MAFYEIQFPTDISLNSRGGPGWKTLVTTSISGKEVRLPKWSEIRHSYDVMYGVRTTEQLQALVAFFNEMRGMAHGFRYKDWLDYQLTDEVVNADGSATTQLTKVYGSGSNNFARDINKPTGQGTMTVNSIAYVDYTLDTTTGIITWTSTPPSGGDTVLWTGEFDVPCRFNTDMLDVTLSAADYGDTSVELVELKL